jgi:gluconate kinase
MQLLVLFGLPGIGKTYVGKLLEKDFGFFLYEADKDLPQDMQKALAANAFISDDMRNRFFKSVITTTKALVNTHKKIVVTQTFIKEIYREQFLKTFPNAQFVLIETPTILREKRLTERKNYPLDKTYARNMVRIFENPHIPHQLLTNDTEGAEKIKMQLTLLLK